MLLVFKYVNAYMLGMRDLSIFFAALADESRLHLLYLMKDGEICVCLLQAALQASQPKVSRHLAYLKRAGLVEARREGKWMHYRLKKLECGQQTILAETLNELERQAPIKKNLRRLRQIQCYPSRYGIASDGLKGER